MEGGTLTLASWLRRENAQTGEDDSSKKLSFPSNNPEEVVGEVPNEQFWKALEPVFGRLNQDVIYIIFEFVNLGSIMNFCKCSKSLYKIHQLMIRLVVKILTFENAL